MKTPSGSGGGAVGGALAEQIVQNVKVHLNLGQNFIVVAEDKVTICLMRHLAGVEAARAWVAPLGILCALVITLVTAKFQDYLLPAPTWQAIFILSAILSAVWLARAIYVSWRAPTLQTIVDELKREAAKTDAGVSGV